MADIGNQKVAKHPYVVSHYFTVAWTCLCACET